MVSTRSEITIRVGSDLAPGVCGRCHITAKEDHADQRTGGMGETERESEREKRNDPHILSQTHTGKETERQKERATEREKGGERGRKKKGEI